MWCAVDNHRHAWVRTTCAWAIRAALGTLLGCGVYGCEQRTGSAAVTDPSQGVVGVASDDAEMNAAIARARSSVSRFTAAFASEDPGLSFFSVKKPYAQRSGGKEHIWIDVTEIVGDTIRGTIADDPVDIAGMRFGDAVELTADEITDWMYVNAAREVVGGYTIRVLVHRSTPEELAASGLGAMRFAEPD